MIHIVFSSQFWEMRVDADRELVWLTRTEAPVGSIDELRAANQDVILAMRPQHLRWGLVVDMRRAPARNDPEFEAAMRPLREAVERRYARTALLLASAAGVLQVQRLARQEGAGTFVTTDEREAVRFALDERTARRGRLKNGRDLPTDR